MLIEEGFRLELIGSDISAQNFITDSPNKYLGNMMRCLLHAADLGLEYWSLALPHAIYIKNRVPHSLIKKKYIRRINWTITKSVQSKDIWM